MTLKRRASGAWVDIATTIKRKASGSWVDVAAIKRRASGAWVHVWPLVSISDQNISDFNSPTAKAYYRLKATGTVEQETQTLGTSTLETWLFAGAAADYEARCTVTAGALSGAGNTATGVWAGLGSDRRWGCLATGSLDTATLTIEIRAVATGTVLDTVTVELTADAI